jgi:molecular chaperone GrpE (heat shock protein)
MAEALSASVVQVLALAQLRGSGEVEAGGDEVLAAALRMVRALERCGVRVVGAIGERVSFDPTRHDPLSADTVLEAGQPAVVRIVGLAYGNSVLRKAGVEAVEG